MVSNDRRKRYRRMGADETQVEAFFGRAISLAKQQKSTSLATRAEATYAEYCCQKRAAAIDAGRLISCQGLRQSPAGDPCAEARKPTARLGPKKISITN